MRYIEYVFGSMPRKADALDVLAAMLGECGFETFDMDGGVLTGYIQASLVDEDAICDVVRSVEKMFGVRFDSLHRNIPDANWNVVWEQEMFRPIVINDELVIHSTNHVEVPACQYDILINPCRSFGTGTHSTTRMLLEWLLDNSIDGASVIDAGCGTGILGILAMKRGADSLLGYDVDQWSVNNARQNCKLNNVSADILLGDSNVLANRTCTLLMANINRNILLADIPRFAGVVQPTGTMLLSGFYMEDVPRLTDCAIAYGFETVKEINDDGGWTLLQFRKISHSPCLAKE